ncbi:MAG TPA: hypothetical protein PLU49_14465, partial [Saprospiraceae bacterium]|nr:hypothetical protein [Saprospiraceae bacterium]
DNQTFLFQAEAQLFPKIFTDPASVIHPFTLLPFAGQLMLLITLFQPKPSKILGYIGIGSLSLLLVFIFIIGLLSMNFKIIFSTIPFITMAIFAIQHYRKKSE